MSLQVPDLLLPQGRGVQQCSPAAPQAGAVGDEGGDPDMEGAGRGHSGAPKVQGQSAGHDSHRVGQRSGRGI